MAPSDSPFIIFIIFMYAWLVSLDDVIETCLSDIFSDVSIKQTSLLNGQST